MPSASAIAFDTHASVKRLMQSGMPEAQAEALVEVVSKTADMPDISNLATKADLEQLRLATKADLDQLRLATKADLEQLRLSTKADIAGVDARITMVDARVTAVKGELIYWIIGASAVNALAQLLPHYLR
jgi:hypothetical protein